MKFFAILSLFTIGFTFTSCHKDNGNNTNNDSSSHSHKARYEIVSLGEGEANIEITYATQNGIGCCNGVTTKNEMSITPWQHEFTIYDQFPFMINVWDEDFFTDNAMPIKALLYVDDVLVAEQQNNNHSYILIQYYYND